MEKLDYRELIKKILETIVAKVGFDFARTHDGGVA
jgi:hypothetical protein